MAGRTAIASTDRDAQRLYASCMDEIDHRLQEFLKRGSGWVLQKINWCRVSLVQYTAMAGRAYMILPKWIQNKMCCVNVRNTDNRCFWYAWLAGTHPLAKNADRPSA